MNKNLEETKMKIYYEGNSSMGIPQNILNDVHSLFSNHKIEYLDGESARVIIPEKEEEMIKSFRNEVRQLLLNIKKENSVLAMKLARYHGIR
jgi:hypothetical protein